MKLILKTGQATNFSRVNEELLAQTKMGNVEKRWVPTTDGKQMLVWVIYPPDFDPEQSYPTLLYAQGGPQGTVSQFFSYRWNFQVMAAQGYIVVAPQPQRTSILRAGVEPADQRRLGRTGHAGSVERY